MLFSKERNNRNYHKMTQLCRMNENGRSPEGAQNGRKLVILGDLNPSHQHDQLDYSGLQKIIGTKLKTPAQNSDHIGSRVQTCSESQTLLIADSCGGSTTTRVITNTFRPILGHLSTFRRTFLFVYSMNLSHFVLISMAPRPNL